MLTEPSGSTLLGQAVALLPSSTRLSTSMTYSGFAYWKIRPSWQLFANMYRFQTIQTCVAKAGHLHKQCTASGCRAKGQDHHVLANTVQLSQPKKDLAGIILFVGLGNESTPAQICFSYQNECGRSCKGKDLVRDPCNGATLLVEPGQGCSCKPHAKVVIPFRLKTLGVPL